MKFADINVNEFNLVMRVQFRFFFFLSKKSIFGIKSLLDLG